jgi:beta-lactamase class A
MMVAGPNPIVVNFVHPGIKLSVANLIEVMITESDNTATDASLKLAGGPEAVTKMLRSIGITEQRVDRECAEILRDFYGLPDKAYASVVAEASVKDPALVAKTPDRNIAFEKDPRDQSTPKAMLELLLAIDSGKVLSEKSREFLLATMSRTRTGEGRLKGLLPKGTPVAHKTGTLGGVANDVGFISLPDGRRFAIAVFTKSSTTPGADRDRAIAEISRTIYDFYYLTAQDK